MSLADHEVNIDAGFFFGFHAVQQACALRVLVSAVNAEALAQLLKTVLKRRYQLRIGEGLGALRLARLKLPDALLQSSDRVTRTATLGAPAAALEAHIAKRGVAAVSRLFGRVRAFTVGAIVDHLSPSLGCASHSLQPGKHSWSSAG